MLLGQVLERLGDEMFAAETLVALEDLHLMVEVETAGRQFGESLGEYASGASRRFAAFASDEDWLALTPEEARPIRLERYSSVAKGAIGRGLRAGIRESGEEHFSEELMLPFGDVGADGAHQVLLHVAWRQTPYNPTVTGVEHAVRLAIEFQLTPLTA